MRILHTSDWHLGATLSNYSRMEEQRALVDEICRIARDRQVDLVLIAGDVYDSFNPPASAEELFLSALANLTASGISVVAIAGNHDSPERLSAPADLAAAQSAYILSLPGQTPHGSGLIDCGPNWLRIRPGNAGCDAVIAALPYPSLGRLGCEEDKYSDTVEDIMLEACSHFASDAVSVAVTHLFARGGVAGSAERPIEGVGGALAVDVSALGNAQYTALGHLHRPQRVGGAWYPGSILQQDFGESGQTKQVLLVDVEPGQEAQVTPVLLVCGRYLARWQVGSLDEALAFVEAGRDAQAWIEVVLNSQIPPREEQMRELQASRERVVYMRWTPDISTRQRTAIDWTVKPKSELFAAFYEHQKGCKPSKELTKLFLRMCADDESAPVQETVSGEGEYESAVDDIQTGLSSAQDEARDRAAALYSDADFESGAIDSDAVSEAIDDGNGAYSEYDTADEIADVEPPYPDATVAPPADEIDASGADERGRLE